MRDPWRMSERMGRLRGANRVWLKGEKEMVGGLVGDLFGRLGGDSGPCVGEVLRVGFPYSSEELRGWVLRALGHTKNGLAPGPYGIVYRLMKAVSDTWLGRELVDEIVDNLVRGVIPPAWMEIGVVFIPKPGCDITLTKSWRPLNLINCIGKLWEKVVADRIQDFRGELFHHLQFGSVRGRSAVDVLYHSVVRAQRCLDATGGVGWGFWNMKGGFHHVVGGEVLRCLDGVEGTRGLCQWVPEFVSLRNFEVSWDGSVRGWRGQWSGCLKAPLSPLSCSWYVWRRSWLKWNDGFGRRYLAFG